VLDVDATIAALTRDPARTALCVDFDGSLAPIVERAEDARPLPGALTQLERLAPHLGRIAVISGRPVGYLVEHVPIRGVTYTGLYGMEHVDGDHRTVDPRVEPYLGQIATVTNTLTARFGPELVEPKSGVSVTVHWRPAPERAEEMCEVADQLAEKYSLATLRTRMAIEIRPPIAVDKGDAARAAITGFDRAAFAGDDTGDLPAFGALRDAVADGTLQAAVCIGVHSPEAPPELVATVDILVDGPGGLVALLARVADEIVEPHAGGTRSRERS
jgi:trehalose 6-phosphate phosphatase